VGELQLGELDWPNWYGRACIRRKIIISSLTYQFIEKVHHRFDIICLGGTNDKTFGIPEVEMYNSEENSWSFKKPIISGLLLPDLLPDPEGGLILVGGLTSNYSKFQIYLS